MVKYTFYLENDQVRFLRKLKGSNTSEHIRRAIEQYIRKKMKEEFNVSISLSKGGEHVR